MGEIYNQSIQFMIWSLTLGAYGYMVGVINLIMSRTHIWSVYLGAWSNFVFTFRIITRALFQSSKSPNIILLVDLIIFVTISVSWLFIMRKALFANNYRLITTAYGLAVGVGLC